VGEEVLFCYTRGDILTTGGVDLEWLSRNEIMVEGFEPRV
jgi:hypothetical protein